VQKIRNWVKGGLGLRDKDLNGALFRLREGVQEFKMMERHLWSKPRTTRRKEL
jgi:hypothetical protein